MLKNYPTKFRVVFLDNDIGILYNDFMKKKMISVVLVLVIFVLVGFFLYKDLSGRYETTEDVTAGSEITPEGQDSGYKIETVSGGEVNQAVVGEVIKAPALGLPVTNYKKIDNTAFELAKKNISILENDLKKNPDDEFKWVNLATFRKMVGDYQSSVTILTYVSKRWTIDHVPYINLADIYQYYLKDNKLAEKNLLKVIELKPDYSEAYINLYNLYKDSYTEKKDQAISVLLKGLKSSPRSTDIMINAARYYKNSGDVSSAKKYYNMAINEAVVSGAKDLEQAFKSEVAELN